MVRTRRTVAYLPGVWVKRPRQDQEVDLKYKSIYYSDSLFEDNGYDEYSIS